MLKTIERSILLFAVLLVTFFAGGMLGGILPAPEGRYIFTPGNEVGSGISLLAVSFSMGVCRRFRGMDLALSCVIAQAVVAIVVLAYAGVSWDFYSHWLWGITRSITPPIALGMGLGMLTRLVQRKAIAGGESRHCDR